MTSKNKLQDSGYFIYEIGGKLIPAPDHFGMEPDPEGDIEHQFRRWGYDKGGYRNLGNEDGTYGFLRIHSHDNHPRWIFQFIDGNSDHWCEVLVEGWPAFLDALSRYLPIVDHMEMLCDREHKRIVEHNQRMTQARRQGIIK